MIIVRQLNIVLHIYLGVAKLWHQLPSVIRGKNITHKQLKMRIVIVKKYSSYGNLEKLIINSQPSQQSPALHKSTQVRQSNHDNRMVENV